MQSFARCLGGMLVMASIFDVSLLAKDKPTVEMKTSMGTIVLELYPEKAPETVSNFLAYVDSGFYAGTIFHRVISDFMIQGGGFTEDIKALAVDPSYLHWVILESGVPSTCCGMCSRNCQQTTGIQFQRN